MEQSKWHSSSQAKVSLIIPDAFVWLLKRVGGFSKTQGNRFQLICRYYYKTWTYVDVKCAQRLQCVFIAMKKLGYAYVIIKVKTKYLFFIIIFNGIALLKTHLYNNIGTYK